MQRYVLSEKPLKDGLNEIWFQCSRCKCLTKTFTRKGYCLCGKKVDFKKFKRFYIYKLK